MTGPVRHGGVTGKEIIMDARLNFLGNPVSLIALINAYNRMNVIVRQPAGDYQPGMFG